jgi:sporulation protein YlmC with PRC-barrel domain
MKSYRFRLAAVASAIILASSAAVAQQASPPKANQSGTNASTDANRNLGSKPGLGKLDDKTSGATVRVSQLMGANIKNSNGDGVGEIKDLVLDSSGKVRYAAVTYGGFLGVGSKLFAVPFEAFRVRQDPDDPNDRDDYVLTLDVTKEQLDGAQGFDNEKWPSFADTKMTQELDRRYNIERSQTGQSR